MPVLVLAALAGCGTPGDPMPPQALVLSPVADLAARQAGESVVLTFTLPQTTVEGLPLETPPQIEIYRTFAPANVQPAAAQPPATPAYTIPATLVDTYLEEGRVRFVDPLKPEELARHAGQQAVYRVRTRASKRRASEDSNPAAVRIFPVPEPIRDLSATLTEAAVELRWTPPVRTTSGAPIVALGGYRIYRAELEPGAETTDPSKAKRKTPLELLGVSPSPSYRDTQFQFDRTYLYTVRSVAQYESESVESGDSQPVVATARDTFPPAAPKNLVAVLVPATLSAPAQIELSWSISPEADVAGYHIYRSEQENAAGERRTHELLPTPTFRDMSVEPGRVYWYRVTAVDHTGNESPHSTPVSATVPPRNAKEKP